MPRRSSPTQPDQSLALLRDLLDQFETRLASDDLRSQVLALVPAVHALRDLGSSLIAPQLAASASQRILMYFVRYPRQIVTGDELLVISGIGEWARRVRELRVQSGWKIASGVTMRQILAEENIAPEFPGQNLAAMRPEDYILLDNTQDREAAHRWHRANAIRRGPDAVRDKILAYFRENVANPVTGEELRYVANNRTEWARRVREVRTEHGWPVATRNTGRPDLAVGEYVLEADRQSPPHDRNIPDPVRGNVLRRDNFKCRTCGWTQEQWHRADPRNLELHHIDPHHAGGTNEADNLLTLCNVCHDDSHRHEN